MMKIGKIIRKEARQRITIALISKKKTIIDIIIAGLALLSFIFSVAEVRTIIFYIFSAILSKMKY